MMSAYPPLLDALVLSSGQIIAVGGFGQLGRRGFPVRVGRGHYFRDRFRPLATGHDVDHVSPELMVSTRLVPRASGLPGHVSAAAEMDTPARAQTNNAMVKRSTRRSYIVNAILIREASANL